MKTDTALKRTENVMRLSRGILALVILGFCGSSALALDPMGPPAAGLEQGQFQAGVNFSYSEMDLELENGTWTEFLDGVFYDAGELQSFTLKDFEASKTYINLGYGLADSVEGFIRLGGTKGQFGDSIEGQSEEFDSGNELAGGIGLKATFFEEGGLKLGGLIQASWAEYHGKLDSPNWTWPDFVEMDMAEVQVAAGASYTWEGSISIYGGPFFHFVGGDLDDTIGELVPDDPTSPTPVLVNRHRDWEIREDSAFGGYFGAQLEISDECSLSFEYQKTAAADAFGASFLCRF